MDRTQWMIAPYTEADLESQIDERAEAVRRAGRTGRRRRRRIRRRDQRLHPRSAARPEQAAGRVRGAREAADRMEAHRRDRRGVADRRHLRQGRRRRGALGADARGVRKALRRERRAQGVGRLPRAERPRSADDGLARRFPYETTSPFAKTGLAMPEPGLGHASSPTAPPRVAPVADRHRQHRHALAAADPRRRLDRLAAAAQRAAGPGARLQLGARQQGTLERRPLDRRDGAAGRLLQPRRS